MADYAIREVKAREILDSKARPMVEVDVWTADGMLGRGASPCGTSVGQHEAFVLRDGGTRYAGLGVQRAVRSVVEVISPALKGRSVLDQRAIDECLIELDGTADKSRLGANAIYSVSIAVARAASCALRVPLYRHLGGPEACLLPVPMFNMVNGGTFGAVRMEFQEFLVIPAAVDRYSEALRVGVEIYSALGEVIGHRYGKDRVRIGSSAGYGAPASEPAEVLEVLLEAATTAGYGGQCRLGLDCAASHFYDPKAGCYRLGARAVGREALITSLEDLARSYDLFMIEDPLEENDFDGFATITRRIPTLIVGDDLFVTNLERVKRGVALQAANAMVLKPNMVGTISEALDAARFAQAHGYRLVGSGRAGGSIDDPIPDIAVAVGAPLVKFGAPRTGERLGKQNCLLRIEEELGNSARFAGPEVFRVS
ncbi:MAG TPA: enolase [Candidatus Methylomirabilis sp.]|nr:enolase [Candidatus Methylomirabilis sp.]